MTYRTGDSPNLEQYDIPMRGKGMTIEEAIEILTPLTKARREGLSLEEALALNLLIEAGKRVQKDRAFPYTLPLPLLPGETEE